MKKTRLLAVLSAAALALTACGANGDLKKTAMEIDGVKVTAGDVAVMAQSQVAYSGADFASSAESIAEQIKLSLEYGALGKAMKIDLTDEEKNQAVATRAQYATSGGGYEVYKKYLESNASSIEFLDTLFTASMYMSKVNEKISEELAEKAATDDELKKFYEESYLSAKHILVNKPEEGAEAAEGEKQGEELAKELLERAKGGEDFDAMVKEYSQDPGSQSNPDGYVFTDGQMVKEFEDGVKSIKAGEFTLVESSYGYHVILRQELPPFEDKKSEVSTGYESKRVENRVKELLDEHKIKSTVNDDVIKSIKEDMLTEAPKKDDVSVSY